MESTRPHNRPTIRDVAQMAGVTKGTVSRYLNGGPWVSVQTRDAIRSAIEELGYVPNGIARNLATDRANSIALIFSEPTRMLAQNAIFGELLEAVTRELAEHGVVAMLMFADRDDLKQQVLSYIRGRHVDGVVVLTASGDDSFILDVKSTGIPLAAAGPIASERSGPIPYVGVDDAMGSRQAVEHLLSIGRSRVGIISGPADDQGAETRLRAGRSVLESADLPVTSLSARSYSSEAGHDATAAMLRANPDLDALYVASDVLAIGALDRLREQGRRVPEDIAVVGFDDTPTAASLTPPLTTIAPITGGATVASLILDLIDGKEPWSAQVPTRLVKRRTT